MRPIKLLFGMLVLLVLAIPGFAQPRLCNITGTIYRPNGTACNSGCSFTISKSRKGGVALSTTPVPVPVDTSGNIAFTATQGSIITVQGNFSIGAINYAAGVDLYVPVSDSNPSSATLASLKTVQEALDGLVATINYITTDEPVITKTPSANLSNEFPLSGLATGLIKNTTGTGVPTIAVGGTDYEFPLTFAARLTRSLNAIDLATTGVTPGSYTCTSLNVDAYGRVTSASNGSCSGGGSGITSLNSQTGASQTFTNDTNITIVSASNAHAITWAGTLAKSRQNAATVYTDAANTWSAGAQDFGAAASLKVPTSAGAAPTANGLLAYDSTSNLWKAGTNGASKTFLMTDGDGSALTNLNASNLASGTVPLGRLSGITTTQLSGSAGITNAQLANSAVTVAAGNGLTTGGAVSLGGSVTLNVGAGTGITVNADDIAINQGVTPTWTALHTHNIGTTPGNAILLDIAAIGSAGTRDSHDIIWRGRSDDGSAHQAEWKAFNDVTGNNGASTWTLQSRIDAASFASRFSVSDAGTVTATLFSGSGASLTNLNASALASGLVPLARGGTGADLSATGGANQFVRQSSAGGALSVSAIADADVPDTITLTNLTQVTNRAISDTTGTLAVARGGTGLTTIAANRILGTSALDTFAALTPANSVEISAGNLQLVGDTASPGNNKLYGTNGSGVKGWYDQPAGGGGSGANPTASVGLTAVNGVATTFLRSDAAPALDQAITPTWTGAHIWTLSNAAAISIGPNGNTNPAFRVVTNVASAATGLSITGNAAGSGVALTVLSSGTDENLALVPKGGGKVTVRPLSGTGTSFEVLRISDAAIRFSVADSGAIVVAGSIQYQSRVAFGAAGGDGSFEVNAVGGSSLIGKFGGTAAGLRFNSDWGVERTAANTSRITNASTGAGNLIIGTSSGAIGTSGAGVLAFSGSTAPSTSPTDTVQTYSGDAAAGDHNLYARNEAGQINRLTGLAVRNSAQFDVTSSTTLATVTGLSENVEAGRTYAFRAYIQTSAGAGGIKLAVGGTATATAISYEGELTSASNDNVVLIDRATALGTTVCDSSTTTTGTCKIEGVIQVNAAGTLVIQFAQSASNGTASSVLANQYLQLIPIS